MCGIAGIYHPSSRRSSVDRGVLTAMNRAHAHRGPDDEGLWTEGPIGLAMRRLNIIDLEGGHQPLSNEDGSVWVVFNGEIYNHKALRKQLEARGHRFKTQTDTEVLVHLYEERGDALVNDLEGMFAFALWDRMKNRLLIARDPMGIKPLFYFSRNGLFLFGSELKTLLAHPAVERTIDTQALSDFLSFLTIPAPKTIFQDVRKLFPGHRLVFEEGRMRIESYWDLRYRPRRDNRTREECQAELKTLTQDAVKSHLMSDVPLGTFLSGGVDSSIVTALAAREMGKGLNTFSVGFDVASHNESSYARLVADHLGTQHHELRLGPSAMEELPAVLACFDEPFGDSSAIPTYHLSRFARKKVTVALAGDGGDELFAGYEWLRRHRWVEFAQQFPKAATEVLSGLLKRWRPDFPVRDGFCAGLARFLEDAQSSGQQAFFRRSTCVTQAMQENLLRPELQREQGGYRSWEIFEAVLSKTEGDLYDQMLAWDSKVYLPDDDLCKVDRVSMAHSLEVRVPILDRSLVEWSAGLPFKWKLRGLETKHLWKSTFADMLPPRIFRQRKQGFSIPLQQWINAYLPGIQRMILGRDSFCNSIFRTEEIQHVLKLQAQGGYRLAGPIYLLLVLELWSQTTLQPSSRIASTPLQEVMA